MKTFTQVFRYSLIALIVTFSLTSEGQSVLNPADSVITYNPAKPPTQPTWGQIGKWVRTVRLPWNTTGYKCYIYEGNQFRLYYPLSYNPTANDGKKYPMMIFYHGEGEAGTVYDNELQLYHGGQIFENAVAAGTFDGYILAMQTTGGWGTSQFTALTNIIDYMVTNNKLDPFRVSGNGLSGGGQGTWFNFEAYPTYFSTLIPMSSDPIQLDASNYVTEGLYTPIWNIHGGLDGSPAPSTAAQVDAAMVAAGANYIDLNMTTQGHDTWDSTWSMAGFWPFLLKGYCSNPWTLFGRTLFCTGNPINLTVGLAAGFQAYQWRQNGVVIPTATSNTINVTQLGTYDARVERNGNWSNWSPLPVIIAINPPTVTPPISISGLMSDAIPAADGRTYVNLQVPNNNYVSYTWEKVGSSTVLGTSQIFQATSPGQYIVSVTQQYGCSSNFSPPFTVINANGTNPPSPASNLVANPLSFTQIQLNWTRNPHPAYTESAFEIYRSTTSSGPYTFIGQVPTDTVDYLDQSLTPNQKYYYAVRAIDSTAAAALSNQASATTQSDKTPPTAPGNLVVLGTTSSTVYLGWNSSTDNVSVADYIVYVNGVKSFTTTDTTFLVTGLPANQENTFSVVAVDGSGNVSPHSPQVTAASINNGLSYNYYTTATAWTVLPNFSTLTPVSSGSMPNVSIAGATQTTNFGYTWSGYITIPVAGTYKFATTSDDGSALWFNSLTVKGTPTVNNDGQHGSTTVTSAGIALTPGVYPIYIEYFQAGGGEAMTVSWSCQALFGNTTLVPIANSYFANTTFHPAGTPPARPTQVAASASSYNKVNVGWTDNSNNETGFEIYRVVKATGIYNYTILTTTGPNVTSFIDSTVQANTTYIYKVQAINQYGGSGFDSASTSGIAYSFYQGTWSNLPAFNSLTPVSTGSMSNISLSPAGPVIIDFAFKFLGFINIPTTGTYTFYTTSDDGSNLYVGGFDSAHLVVKNDYSQGATQRSGTVNLTQGRYPFYVTYFQGTGSYSLVVSYKGPGITMQTIPDSVFYNKQAITTTGALPPAPPTPYNVSASVLSSSAIGLSWQDSSSRITGYQVYRSIGDVNHFVLESSQPASSNYYKDSSLFANQIYYYKIVATGVGGNSAYSSITNATTLDVLPGITMLGNLSVRYGTTTTYTVTATSVNSGTLTLIAYNLPSFASFVDNGNRTGTLKLAPLSQGQYTGSYIVVTDTYGGTDTTKFNISVNNYYAPVLDSISNYTINDNDTLTIPLIGTDQNSSDTLKLSATNLPAGYALTAVSNGVANLFVHPGYAAAGIYNVQVTLNDNNGLSATRSFVLTVNYKAPPDTIIYTRFAASDAIGSPWNSLTSPVSTNLVNSFGQTTTVGLTLSPTSWWNTYNGGPTTGSNSGVYPDAVLEDYYYFDIFGGPDSVNATVTGLDTGKFYNLTFYAGSIWNGAPNNGTTTYKAGGQTVSLYVQGNTKNTVTISSLKPASNGTIPFVMGVVPGSPAGFINALVITQLYDDGTAPAGLGSLTATDVTGKVELNWSDSAYNATGYQIWRALTSKGSYSLLNTLGATAVSFVDSNITGNTSYTYRVQAVNTHGSSAYDSVNTTTLNRVPIVNPIANVSLQNNQALAVNVTTTDDSTAHLTLTAANLPPFATFTDNGNGTGTVTISPVSGTAGVYPNVTITATDQLDSTASASFAVAVTEPNVSSVYVSFSDGLNPVPQPWNMMAGAPFAGTTLSNLINDSNVPTTISISLVNAFQWYVESGMQPYSGVGIYPDVVMRTAYYDGSTNTDQLRVSGLNDTLRYNFVFFGSHDDGQSGMTNYTINGQTVTLQATANIYKTVQINNIAPVNGSVTISVTKASGAAYSFLTSLVIQSYDSSVVGMLNPSGLRVINPTRHSLTLLWQDRTYNETGFEIWRANDSTSSNFVKIGTVGANVTTYTDNNLTQNTKYFYIVRAVNSNSNTYSGYSSPASGFTYDYLVYIAFTPTATASAPWNNLADGEPEFGATWLNFFDETGATTSVGMQVTSYWSGLYPAGENPGNNSGIYPDTVLINSYGLFPGIVGTLQLNGLDQSKLYDLTFMGSSQSYGDVNGSYTVNGMTTIVNAALNINGTGTLYGLSPDVHGNLNITVTLSDLTSQFGLINALVVQAHSPSSNTTGPPTTPGGTQGNTATATEFVSSPTEDTVHTTEKGLSAYPNPFHQVFALSVPSDNNNERVQVMIYDINGRLVYGNAFENLVQGDNYLRIMTNQNLSQGLYLVKVLYASTRTLKTFKLIKQ